MRKLQSSKSGVHLLLDEVRLQEIGGVESPEIVRILDSFTEDLAGYLHLIEEQNSASLVGELSVTLHKLAGASRTCGFCGISRAVEACIVAPKPINARLYGNLKSTIEASILEWQGRISNIKSGSIQ